MAVAQRGYTWDVALRSPSNQYFSDCISVRRDTVLWKANISSSPLKMDRLLASSCPTAGRTVNQPSETSGNEHFLKINHIAFDKIINIGQKKEKSQRHHTNVYSSPSNLVYRSYEKVYVLGNDGAKEICNYGRQMDPEQLILNYYLKLKLEM